MLRNESSLYEIRAIFMSDAAILAASAKTILLEVSKQAGALGAGLQNAAPGVKAGGPNNSVSYLLATSDALTKLADECDTLTTNK